MLKNIAYATATTMAICAGVGFSIFAVEAAANTALYVERRYARQCDARFRCLDTQTETRYFFW